MEPNYFGQPNYERKPDKKRDISSFQTWTDKDAPVPLRTPYAGHFRKQNFHCTDVNRRQGLICPSSDTICRTHSKAEQFYAHSLLHSHNLSIIVFYSLFLHKHSRSNSSTLSHSLILSHLDTTLSLTFSQPLTHFLLLSLSLIYAHSLTFSCIFFLSHTDTVSFRYTLFLFYTSSHTLSLISLSLSHSLTHISTFSYILFHAHTLFHYLAFSFSFYTHSLTLSLASSIFLFLTHARINSQPLTHSLFLFTPSLSLFLLTKYVILFNFCLIFPIF
ncbi:unnamed protein product [Acanthosepion pharaonis]|uniref:Uncharacterized protein n=1 Tax=Acanthosepion pharaonis TaxID=158019 RepID=A0A812DTG7_ACAPH|nr:unnamed protein product [Sepia pharaonis]